MQKPINVYAGFDPTTESLHIGHLIPISVLKRFLMAGHRVIALVGCGTALIGDPSDKQKDRALLDINIVQKMLKILVSNYIIYLRNRIIKKG